MRVIHNKLYRSISDALTELNDANIARNNVRANKTALQGDLKSKLDEICVPSYKVPSEGTVGKWLKGRLPFKGFFYEHIVAFCSERNVSFRVIEAFDSVKKHRPLSAKTSTIVPQLINMNVNLRPNNGLNRIVPDVENTAILEVSLYPNRMSYEFVDERKNSLYSCKVALNGCWLFLSSTCELNCSQLNVDTPIYYSGMDTNDKEKEQNLNMWVVEFDEFDERNLYHQVDLAVVNGIFTKSDLFELAINKQNLKLDYVDICSETMPTSISDRKENHTGDIKEKIRNHILLSAIRRRLNKSMGVLISSAVIECEDAY